MDDLVIGFTMENIDGPGSILGSAGPLHTRTDGTPLSGQMKFDTSDIGSTISDEDFKSVVLHEMGHVLGIGTLWDQPKFGCMGACTPGSNADVFYQCSNANKKYQELGCPGTAIPIETQMGDGSGCGHWSEAKLNNELMTPVLNGGSANPISVITIGALEDIYGAGSVDYSVAGSYSCPTGRLPADYKPPTVNYKLIFHGPIGSLDA